METFEIIQIVDGKSTCLDLKNLLQTLVLSDVPKGFSSNFISQGTQGYLLLRMPNMSGSKFRK